MRIGIEAAKNEQHHDSFVIKWNIGVDLGVYRC